MTLPASAAPTALRNIKPPSQNTAPVHEFACLYTHDLRRKQKRWHDGFLKFHTFNKRAMVYDQSRNHIGDTYWKEGNQMQEGDELTLENGVIVEVAEPKSTTQTDLTPILRKRPVPASSSGAVAQPPNRPLSAVLGTPKGPLGKAQLPIRSPFEERQRNDWTARERATKRQRVAQVPPQPMAPPMRQTPLTDPSLPRSKDVIDLTSDVEEPMSSDVTIPNTPPDLGRPPGRKNTPSPRPRTLKLKAGPQKKMLFCQELAAPPQVRLKTARQASIQTLPSVESDVGPWSTEAMDLFGWLPPGYVFKGQGRGFGLKTP